MTAGIDTAGASRLVQAVKDPLGWLTLALVLTVSMAVRLFGTDDRVATYFALGIVALLIVSFVFIMKWRIPLTKGSEAPAGTVVVNFEFQDQPPLGFDLKNCYADVYGDDSNGTKNVVPYGGPGSGWAVRLPPTMVKPTDPIQLRLRDSNGGEWDTPTFPPFVNTQPLRRRK